MSAPNPRRGQIWLVEWSPGRGSEQLGRRPALVVQTDMANTNPNYPNTIVCALTTKGRPVPTHVNLMPSPENGLAETSHVKCEQLLTISKERLIKLFGRANEADLRRVEAGLRSVLTL